jgi:hypothetical protein
VRRGAASCRAVLRICLGTAAAGVSTAEPSWVAAPQTRQPERGWAVQPAVAVVVALQDVWTPPRRPSLCPRPLSAMRTHVRPTGRVDVRCPGNGVHATGVIRVSGRTGVRCPAAAASALSAPCWPRTSMTRDRPRLTHQVRRVAVVPERLGRRWPNRPGWEAMVERWPRVAGMSLDGRPGPPLRMRTGCGAALAAWPTKGSWSSARCRSVGCGVGEGPGAPKSPHVCPGRLPADARPWAGPGVVTTLGGR